MNTKEFFSDYSHSSKKVDVPICDIPDDVDTLVFGGINVIYHCNKSRHETFSNIKQIILKDGDYLLQISNKNFPNVEWVESENPSYLSGKYLVMKDKLLNTFLQTPDTVIDMKGIKHIDYDAFVGCKAKRLIHDEDLCDTYFASTFKESGFLENKPVNGKIKAGRIVIKLDPNADKVLINDPGEVFALDVTINGEDRERAAQIRDLIIDAKDSISAIRSKVLESGFKSMIFRNFKREELRMISFFSSRYSYCLTKNIVLENCSGYQTIDGLLYEERPEGLTLLKCPVYHDKEVRLPDNCVGIESYAFLDVKSVESVFIPKAVTDIRANAFHRCQLKSITFEEGSNLKCIEPCCFEGCVALEKVILPSKIEMICCDAFKDCQKLHTMILPEGLRKIRTDAFYKCNSLKEIAFPDSLQEIQENFDWPVEKITVKNCIPNELFTSLITPCIGYVKNSFLEISSSDKHIFLPKMMSNPKIEFLESSISFKRLFEDIYKLRPFYSYGKTPEIKQDVAFQEFKAGDKKVEKYLRKSSQAIVSRYMENQQINDVAFLIKHQLLSRSAIEDLKKINRDTTIAAYLVNDRGTDNPGFSL